MFSRDELLSGDGTTLHQAPPASDERIVIPVNDAPLTVRISLGDASA